jgi:hypothetical protein
MDNRRAGKSGREISVGCKIMISKFSIYTFSYFILLFVFGSCTSKKVEITKEYIINENWSRKNEKAWANSITITQMKVNPDSTINPFTDLHQPGILNKLEEDTSFTRYANIRLKEGESYSNKKIFFNRDNGFYWGTRSRFDNSEEVKTIGNLQNGNWYRFSDLGTLGIQSIYIYIDSTGSAHRFDVWHSNY